MCGSRFSRDWNSFLASGCDDVSEEQAAIVQLLCVFRVVALGWSDGGSVTALVLGWLIKNILLMQPKRTREPGRAIGIASCMQEPT